MNDLGISDAELEAYFNKRHRCCVTGCMADASEHYDGHGIYLFRACDKHYAEKIKGYRPDIHEAYFDPADAGEALEPDDY